MADLNEAKQELIDLIFIGLDHGIDSIKDSGGPLVPFVITDTSGERKIMRFVTENLEEGPVKARQHLTELIDKPNFAVIVYDGYITVKDKKFDAVLAQGYDRDDVTSYMLAQRYQPKKLLSKFKTIGNAAFLGTEQNII